MIGQLILHLMLRDIFGLQFCSNLRCSAIQRLEKYLCVLDRLNRAFQNMVKIWEDAMQYCLKEKIGNTELFTGRKYEMTDLLQWIEQIKPEISMSTAILSRRKTGKTSFLQRLYNITYDKNDGVIPFYYEIKDQKQCIVNYSRDFFLTFIYQYIAFKTRKPEYLDYSKRSYSLAIETAKKEGQDHLVPFIVDICLAEKDDAGDSMLDISSNAPRLVIKKHNERVVQMIDEFQYLNRRIYHDKILTHLRDDLAGGYLHTAEYKNAPLLIAGSWVGWLMSDINKMLPGRFIYFPFNNLPESESIEMIHKYSEITGVPVTEETVYMIAELTEGSPFYISSLFRSKYPEKDLSTKDNLIKTLEFEILDNSGIVRSTWSEYLNYALDEVNSVHSKQIVLYLNKHKDRRIPRYELIKELKLEIPERELDKKMKALIQSDIINRAGSRYRYQAIQDNIFEKVFLGEFGGDLESFDPERDIANSYTALMEKYKKKYQQVLGKLNRTKGIYAEYTLIDILRYKAYQDNERLKSMFYNLPKDFDFTQYEKVWTYSASPTYQRSIQVDIYARAKPGDYSLIGEVKKRKRPFSVKEAEIFLEKAQDLMELEKFGKAVFFVYSTGGFFKNTKKFLEKNGMAWCEDEQLIS